MYINRLMVDIKSGKQKVNLKFSGNKDSVMFIHSDSDEISTLSVTPSTVSPDDDSYPDGVSDTTTSVNPGGSVVKEMVGADQVVSLSYPYLEVGVDKGKVQAEIFSFGEVTNLSTYR